MRTGYRSGNARAFRAYSKWADKSFFARFVKVARGELSTAEFQLIENIENSRINSLRFARLNVVELLISSSISFFERDVEEMS
jgi:hypothetical protein